MKKVGCCHYHSTLVSQHLMIIKVPETCKTLYKIINQLNLVSKPNIGKYTPLANTNSKLVSYLLIRSLVVEGEMSLMTQGVDTGTQTKQKNWIQYALQTIHVHGLYWYYASNSKLMRFLVGIFTLAVLVGLPIWTVLQFINWVSSIQIDTVTGIGIFTFLSNF